MEKWLLEKWSISFLKRISSSKQNGWFYPNSL